MGISTETLVCEDMISCTDLARRRVVYEIATFDLPLFCLAAVTIQL